jgi:hypothetical protein
MNYQPGKNPIIKNLMPGLTEKGKIKIGRKKAPQDGKNYQLPEKLEHFVVTTLERDATNNFIRDESIHKLLGDKPKRIPIQLLFNDIVLNLQSRYSCYSGKTLWCSGDGEFAFRQKPKTNDRDQVGCPCYRSEPKFNGDNNDGKGKCKINCTLSCIIEGAESVGGVWKFRTTGYNSYVGLLGSLILIHTKTGGFLCGLPLALTIQPKVATDPIDGKSLTIQVVGVEFDGSMQKLRDTTLKLAQQSAEFNQRMISVETEVRKMISVDSDLVDQAGDIVDEFAPENNTPETPTLPVVEDAPKPIDTPTGQAPAVINTSPGQAPAPIDTPTGQQQASDKPGEKAAVKRGRKPAAAVATQQVPQTPAPATPSVPVPQRGAEQIEMPNIPQSDEIFDLY